MPLQTKHSNTYLYMRPIKTLLLLAVLLTIDSLGQSNNAQYTPVTINSPLFNSEDEIQIGMNLNNFGFNYKAAGQLNSKILIFSLQHNTGRTKFDPLNFNDYVDQGEGSHLIQSKPAKMFYSEIGFGYNFRHKSQKISLISGIGYQFQNPNTRLFIQFDWGNESRLINAGVSFRGNYTNVQNERLLTLEPVLQGKVKIWNFRIINQFGYSIAMKKGEDYMKPIITIGIEYVIGNSNDNQN